MLPEFVIYTMALDTAYSQKSPDKFAITFAGITRSGVYVQLGEQAYNNRDLVKSLAPSDIPPLLEAYAEAQRQMWGLSRDIFIDNADQATIAECAKYKNRTGTLYNFPGAWKKTKIIDRIHLQRGWMATGHWRMLDTCTGTIEEMNSYSWKDDKYEPQDGGDHFINSGQYGWLPFKSRIGDAGK